MLRLLMVAIMVLATNGITAEADQNGITVYGDSALECISDVQPVAIGYTPWLVRPAVGQVIVVTCFYPGSTGFHHVVVTVQGRVFVPFVANMTTAAVCRGDAAECL